MVGLGLRSLHLAGVRWPYPRSKVGNVCPALPDHKFGRYCCRRCGLLTAEGHSALPMWRGW